MNKPKTRYLVFRPHETIATLERRQTQFIRPVEPQPTSDGPAGLRDMVPLKSLWWHPNETTWHSFDPGRPESINSAISPLYCPFGQVGDRIVIKESWRPRSWGADFDWMMVEYAAGGRAKHVDPAEVWGEDVEDVWRKLSDDCIAAACPQSEEGYFTLQGADGRHPIKWRSPVTMPRQLSRLALEIADVRVLRVQDLTEEDAIAHGIYELLDGPEVHYLAQEPSDERQTRYAYPIGALKQLWRDEKVPYDDETFYWVVDYKRIEEGA